MGCEGNREEFFNHGEMKIYIYIYIYEYQAKEKRKKKKVERLTFFSYCLFILNKKEGLVGKDTLLPNHVET